MFFFNNFFNLSVFFNEFLGDEYIEYSDEKIVSILIIRRHISSSKLIFFI